MSFLHLIKIVEDPVCTTPEGFENVAFFLRHGLPSTPISQENGAFRKRSSISLFEIKMNGQVLEVITSSAWCYWLITF